MPVCLHSRNHLLASLPPVAFELLRPHLRTVELLNEAVLVEAGDPIVQVYFPHDGIISLVVGLAGGEMVEVAMVGRDSFFGASAALVDPISLTHAIVQLPGTASVVDAEKFRIVVAQSAPIRAVLFHHERFLFAQAQQSAACNASHSVESRMARCLLRMRDLSGHDNFRLTQEVLAQMIGARRNSVSLVAHTLQHAGIIRYSRGLIEIMNLQGLRDAVCECYGTVKAHHDRLMKQDR
jgi:CRP-like cAMP-binding protein